MKSAIVAKLDRELNDPVTDEQHVVYILVEAQKLLELTGALESYHRLRLFCD